MFAEDTIKIPLFSIVFALKFSIKFIEGVKLIEEVEFAGIDKVIGIKPELAGIEIVTLATEEYVLILKYIGRSYCPYVGLLTTSLSGAANQNVVSV